jgi:hypothetical protein
MSGARTATCAWLKGIARASGGRQYPSPAAQGAKDKCSIDPVGGKRPRCPALPANRPAPDAGHKRSAQVATPAPTPGRSPSCNP